MNQTEHAETTVYLPLDASTMVASKQVHIEDIASVFCSQPDIMHDVKKIKLFTFRDNEQGQLVVNALAIIGEILKYDKSVTVQNIGSQECVLRSGRSERKKRMTAAASFTKRLIN